MDVPFSALSIPVDKNMFRNNYTSLSSATLQALRDKFKHITTVIIDGISMVSYNLFEVIHKRLTEIKDKTNNPNLKSVD
jgi:hypothetical protein